MPKRVHSMFPKFEERSRLYLIGGHDGSIKIGQSKRIRSRAMNHRQHMLANFGRSGDRPERRPHSKTVRRGKQTR